MKPIDALNFQITRLGSNANKIRDSIDTLRSGGHDATSLLAELVKTCEEIGRLGLAIQTEIDKNERQQLSSTKPPD